MQKKIMDFEHPTLQGVTNERALTQGVASLALGYVLLPFQGVHCWLHLSNSSKLDCIRLARLFSPHLLNPKFEHLFFNRELFRVFTLKLAIILHNGLHIGFYIARGDDGLGANNAFVGEVDGVEQYGKVGFEGYKIETTFPFRG